MQSIPSGGRYLARLSPVLLSILLLHTSVFPVREARILTFLTFKTFGDVFIYLLILDASQYAPLASASEASQCHFSRRGKLKFPLQGSGRLPSMFTALMPPWLKTI